MRIEDAVAALEEARGLVTPDGANLELLSVDDDARSITLRLHLDEVACLECMMPRDYLERLTLSTFQEYLPELQRITIIDPRESSGVAGP